MAALRIFARRGLSAIARTSQAIELWRNDTSPFAVGIQKRWSNYKGSSRYRESVKYTDFEITNDPKEWAYVERLLRSKTVPPPLVVDEPLPSGWIPPSEKGHEKPYFVKRTKNYMLPVYLCRTFRGMRKITLIRYIEGDIWMLESELNKAIETQTKKKVGTIINEFTGKLKFKGDHVFYIKHWLETRGF